MARNFQLTVKTDTRNSRPFTVTPEMQIETLRTRVAEAENCEAGDVLLIYGEKKLTDSQNLSYFGINSECVVDMFYREPRSVTIMIADGSAKKVTINVNDTLETLQVKVSQKFNMPGQNFLFTYAGTSIAAKQNLYDLNIEPLATINATVNIGGGRQSISKK